MFLGTLIEAVAEPGAFAPGATWGLSKSSFTTAPLTSR